MRFIDLCAGIGGFSLGLEWAGMTCAGQVEIDPFCNAVLEKHWPDVPRWKDVKNESNDYERKLGTHADRSIDLICGGYPCQPFSHAGKRRGADDDRHLWPYVFRICQRLRPAWCLFENVAGHVTLGLDQVLSDLEGEGYAAVPLVIPACAVDAPHRRDRVWIIAHAASGTVGGNSSGEQRESPGRGAAAWRKDLRQADRENGSEFLAADGEVVADADCSGRKMPNKIWKRYNRSSRGGQDVSDTKHCKREGRDQEGQGAGSALPYCRWLPEPDVGRVADGVPMRVAKLKALGNAVVPQVVYEIGRAIWVAHYGENYVTDH